MRTLVPTSPGGAASMNEATVAVFDIMIAMILPGTEQRRQFVVVDSNRPLHVPYGAGEVNLRR